MPAEQWNVSKVRIAAYDHCALPMSPRRYDGFQDFEPVCSCAVAAHCSNCTCRLDGRSLHLWRCLLWYAAHRRGPHRQCDRATWSMRDRLCLCFVKVVQYHFQAGLRSAIPIPLTLLKSPIFKERRVSRYSVVGDTEHRNRDRAGNVSVPLGTAPPVRDIASSAKDVRTPRVYSPSLLNASNLPLSTNLSPIGRLLSALDINSAARSAVNFVELSLGFVTPALFCE